MEARREAIRNLMAHPSYFTLRAPERLSLIRKAEAGIPGSTLSFWLKALYWVKTGKLLE
jgi:hypothetical protein